MLSLCWYSFGFLLDSLVFHSYVISVRFFCFIPSVSSIQILQRSFFLSVIVKRIHRFSIPLSSLNIAYCAFFLSFSWWWTLNRLSVANISSQLIFARFDRVLIPYPFFSLYLSDFLIRIIFISFRSLFLRM